MAELGTYHVKIQATAVGISKQIKEQFGAPVDKEAQGAGKRIGGFMSRGIASAFLAIGGAAAIGGVFKSSIGAAREFETGMNEVFTLLPGISDKAMGDMKGQVKDFSKEFGVLPNEAIPALYQSLSAGVPQDNVFEFMEQAQKAAKGGVSDLTTAVSGISSVTNAYGSDVLSAAEASDMMFTAVKGGVTTFGEMASSLGGVTPLASAMGVKFEDVAAGVAAITKQGPSTSEAVTGIKGALAELGKSGSIADKAFQQIAGKSFPEFIAEGGNLHDALMMMQEGAEAAGLPLNNMFGSIEAGNAAMALTKGGGEDFAGLLSDMQNSAGATDAAFEQMNQGIGPAFDKLKANAQVALISIGEKLAPFVTTIAEKLPGAMDAAAAAASDWGGKLADLGKKAKPAFDAVKDFVQGPLRSLVTDKTKMTAALAAIGGVAIVVFTGWAASAAAAAVATLAATWPIIAIGAAVAAVAAGFVLAYQKVDWFRAGVDAVVGWLRDSAWPVIKQVFSWIATFVSDSITRTRELIGVFVGWARSIWARWGDEIVAVARFAWDYISSQVQNVMGVIRGVIKTVTSLIKGDWSGAWAGIKQIASSAASYLKTLLSAAWTVIRTVAVKAFTVLKDSVGRLLRAARDAAWRAANSLRDRVVDAFRRTNERAVAFALALVDWVRGLPGRLLRAIGNVNVLLAQKGRDLIQGLWNAAKAKFDDLRGWLAGLGSRAVSAVGGMTYKLYQAGRDLIQGMVNGVKAKAGDIANAARDAVNGAISAAKNVLGISSPSKVFRQFGVYTVEGFVDGVDRSARLADRAVARMVSFGPPNVPDLVGASGVSGRGDTTNNWNISVQDGRDLNSAIGRTQKLVPHIL